MTPAPALDRLLATCGALSLALAPHLGHLPLWVAAAFAAAVGWRLLAEQRGWALPPASLRAALALGGTLGVLAGYRTLNGLDAGTALLTIMAALKLSETRRPRDHAVLVLVGYLLCLATLLYEQSFLHLAYALAAAWLLTAALARVHRPVEANTAVRPLRLAARVLVLGLPLAAVLFLFVPRIEGRFWAVPAPAGHHLSGIDDEMSPGDVAELGLSDEPAFRAWFEGPLPPPEQRYWRVLVLEDFDGRRWRQAGGDGELPAAQVEPGGPRYRYRIALEPTERAWLPGLDTVVEWPGAVARRGGGGQLLYFDARRTEQRNVTARLDYVLGSATGARVMAGSLAPGLGRRDLALPPGRAPRARALALQLRAASRDDGDYIARLLARFHDEPYGYTLAPPALGAEPVDEFLFGTRQGFCEHYASAFAVLMRAAGIPARVVVGYQGGEFNGYGGYLLVRQSSAHAWTEVWLQGRGWLRVDPTAAVAPDRIRRGELTRELAEAGAGRLYAELAWLGRLRSAWDALRTRSYEAIVGFDPQRQARLVAALGLGDRGWQGLALALAGGFGVAALAIAAWLAWELRPRARDAVLAGWDSACARLAAAGLPRAPAEGPLDYARRVAGARPALAPAIQQLAAAYVAARYLPGATAAERERFRVLVRGLAQRLRAARG